METIEYNATFGNTKAFEHWLKIINGVYNVIDYEIVKHEDGKRLKLQKITIGRKENHNG